MRFGFVAASLTVHAAVVGLAWRFAPVGERATQMRVEVSGLPSDELEVTAWVPSDRDDVAPVAPAPKAASEPAADTPRDATAAADATPLVHAPPAREGAPPKNQTRPKPPLRTPTKAPTPLDADATREQAPRPSADKSSGDWMSLDDQLPDSAANAAAKPTSKPKGRDELVERLLAKERDKARLAARDEAQREQAQREQAQREAARTPPKLAAAESEPGPRTPEDENFGDSRAHADLWVELTRWLPRAASSDHAWEELPANSSYEFRVELITEGGKLVDSRLLDAAPTPTKKLLENTSHLMERGKYGGSKRVTHRYELRIRLSSAEPRDLWIAHTTPDPPKPGVGSFIAPSGRRFDVWVSEVD